MKVLTVVGARPQFIKAATVSRAFAALNRSQGQEVVNERIVHTGQHYDANMSKVFFDELEIPPPAINLEVGSGSHGRQTAAMLERLESIIVEQAPDWVLIYGDTNSTLAGALAAVKVHIPVAHVEAGLRSYNRAMPEEINRLVADSVSTLLFCPTQTAVDNLRKEGVTRGVHLVGDVMYDSVLFNTSLARRKSDVLARLNLEPRSFFLATIHRAENTDDPERLAGILQALRETRTRIVLPLHPRTRKTLGDGLRRLSPKVQIVDPVPYLDMLMLESNARVILTDSGGVQKEAYWFGVPCVTLRDETEWVELIACGSNRLAGADPVAIGEAVRWAEEAAAAMRQRKRVDLYGDGKSAEKIVARLMDSR
ncbi:MAG: UDP-N-acetylglucosamine 2-epimerase (non-hydrolyzing) [Phycisphaerae bacterium]|nr:UDP-N-acetylglucosamine 2-epimerase (non-hydrolyzing) [Phycisphaerae bacterium]